MSVWPKAPPCLTDGVVTLRAFRFFDLEALWRMGQDSEVQAHTRIRSPYSRDDAQATLEQSVVQWADRSGARFVAAHAEKDEALIGTVGLPVINWEASHAEVGYAVAPWERRKGHAVRMVDLISSWALADLELDYVELLIEPDNLASVRVAMKTGFVKQSEVRSDVCGGRTVAADVYKKVLPSPR